LSGNVWEWTRSLEGDYPYPTRRAARAKREDLQASEDASRVRRGGAFWLALQYVRCAYRDWYVARVVGKHIGFRVALAGPTYCYVSTARRGLVLFRAETPYGRACSWPRLSSLRPGI
jgi:Sulfatase-modifying factor enzyme 1